MWTVYSCMKMSVAEHGVRLMSLHRPYVAPLTDHLPVTALRSMRHGPTHRGLQHWDRGRPKNRGQWSGVEMREHHHHGLEVGDGYIFRYLSAILQRDCNVCIIMGVSAKCYVITD